MLVRAASRKARPSAARSQSSFEQLYLPWLCPAQNPSLPDRRRRWATFDSASQGPAIRRRRNSNDVPHIQPRRSMATVLGSMAMDDIPFENFNVPPHSSPNYVGLRSGSSRADPLYLLNTYEGIETSQQKIRTTGRVGVGGEVSEILSVFYACLQVGKIERAGVILRRMMSKIDADVDEIVMLHNQYLRASVEQILMSPSEPARQSIHKWFELEIRLKGISHDAEMIAYMLKASLQSPDDAQGGNRKRLVRRYMGMVEGEAGLEVLGLSVLTAEEMNQINHICPTYNLADNLELEDTFEADIYEGDSPSQEPPRADNILADVRAVKQKGLGLKALKKSLSLFSNMPGAGLDMSNKTPEEKRQIQAQLEEDAVSSAIERWRDESVALKKMGLDSTLQTKSLGARMWKWQVAFEQYLKDEIAKVDEAELKEMKTMEDTERCLYGPFLRILPPEKIAAVTILTTMSTLGAQGADKGLMLSHSILSIASSVEDESVFEALQQSNKRGVWSKNSPQRLELDNFKKMVRSRGAGSAAKLVENVKISDESTPFVWKQWPMSMKAKVGAFLMHVLIEIAKVPVALEHAETKQIMTQLQPALSHTFKFKMGKKYGVVVANKVLVQSLKREPVHSLLAKHLPMLVEPEPWTLFNKGGFLVHPSKLMRVKLGDKDQRYYAEAAIGHGDLTDLCRGLDVLGKTEWNINQPVFEVMLEAWNSGDAVGNIAPETPKLVLPPEPEATRDPLERRRWIRAVKGVENQRTGLHSVRCFQNFQLEIARALRNESFYFPHNMDFRGRAYPIPPYLNHMGADHCRGLLKFGKGKELGAAGLKWLKIHLANVYGFDKASLTEREEFSNKHKDDIYDAATNPLKGTRWWLKAEDPWQCLAACIELRNALELPDPTKFVSKLPVHQDGTCNGLQHYAALGGDVWGAKQVNLEPGDRPADVYTAVANLVKESIAEDKKNNDPFAIVLEGKITRKTVKQTVMTNVYGVTWVGARDQVKKQLIAAHHNLPNDAEINPLSLASYIAQKIFAALSTMFRGAHDIQYWFGACAGRVSTCLTPEQIDRFEGELPAMALKKGIKAGNRGYNVEEGLQFKSTVIWTTPLHMPVVQPYRTSKSRSIPTTMQTVALQEPHRSHAVSKRKQLQAFPPNFIHSLDATHMLLSAIKCDDLGLTFAAVHDSFWTHAADIGTMNGVLRDAFIKIHSEDVIGRLAAEFKARYKGCVYLTNLDPKSAAAKEIVKWRKQKSMNTKVPQVKRAPRLDELLLERKRLRLLDSSEPSEVEEGKNMVTPGSIFEKFSSEDELSKDEELKDIGLGEIPASELKAAAKTVKAASNDPSDEDIDMANLDLDDGLSDDVDEASSDMDASSGEDADVDEGGEASEETEEAEEAMGSFEKRLTSRESRQQKFPIWLPLTFPKVPKKGEFDVSRLKNSQYFFS
ncbi:DNA-directed RNA polymerase, mitochondrial [Lachnellula occidentalis]|uniref:DNA-directed RNA polymerase n=1 Tax=Lachnellula occidentalis TaxID=215460 RepID=A0A8H8S3U2_9HELO|nr:DNA-directed RNA polymerase, mitochondrial [Lachnellula occidentalis]